MNERDRIAAIFDRERAQAHYDYETSAHIEWLEGLKNEVLASLDRST